MVDVEIAYFGIVRGSLILTRGGRQVFGGKEYWGGLGAKVVHGGTRRVFFLGGEALSGV